MRLGTPINYKTHSSKNTQRSLDENVKSSYYVIMWYILSQVEHKIIPSKIKSILAATATWLFSRRTANWNSRRHGEMAHYGLKSKKVINTRRSKMQTLVVFVKTTTSKKTHHGFRKIGLAGSTSKVGRRLVTNQWLRQARPLYQPPPPTKPNPGPTGSGRTRSQISPP